MSGQSILLRPPPPPPPLSAHQIRLSTVAARARQVVCVILNTQSGIPYTILMTF